LRLTIDIDARTLVREIAGTRALLDLYSPDAFDLISEVWLKVGWDQKYTHTFSWLGRPVIQLPEDLIRIQEVIHRVRPDVIVETGVAHGGSLVFYASLCKATCTGRVVGVDVEIRPHNRKAIEEHPLAPLITLIEGDSIAPATVDRVRAQIQAGETVLVVLDSCHTREHVLAELEAYSPLVSDGSYIVAADGIMQSLHDTPSGKPEWKWNHPAAAAAEFARSHPEFALDPPPRVFDESQLGDGVTYWPRGWLRRKQPAP